MSIHNLPIEILDAICQLVRPTDLVTLATTHPKIHPVAQRLLYRHLSISSTSRNLSAVITLAKKPHVAQYVRSFSIRLDPYSTVFNSYYRHLATALSAMSELTSLDIFLDPSVSWVLQGTPASVYPRLLHFACSFSFDSYVANFLNKTHALVELEVDSVPVPSPLSVASLPAASLPCLSQFIGSSHVAESIVPGRPIESVHLNSGDLTEGVVESLAKSTAHVVMLGATTSSLPVPLLRLLAEHMRHLVYLRMMTTYNFSEAPDVVSPLAIVATSHRSTTIIAQPFYENVANALASLPDLQTFELSGMHWGSSRKANEDTGRIWQSKPLSSSFGTTDTAEDEPYPDFFAY